jgi:hypothetical protein
VRHIALDHYFEAPCMFKRDGHYYLMYSEGNTTTDTYCVGYAVSRSPLGSFTTGRNSPILVTDKKQNVVSPGHHTMFVKDGQPYIMYHRHSIPFDPEFIGRQLCVDRLVIRTPGVIEPVIPTHDGPEFIRRAPVMSAVATASSPGAERVLDGSYATRWTPAKDGRAAWLQLDLGAVKEIKLQQLRPEYAWKTYRFNIETSEDGQRWTTLADLTCAGSPIVINTPCRARYLRLKSAISLFEWSLH